MGLLFAIKNQIKLDQVEERHHLLQVFLGENQYSSLYRLIQSIRSPLLKSLAAVIYGCFSRINCPVDLTESIFLFSRKNELNSYISNKGQLGLYSEIKVTSASAIQRPSLKGLLAAIRVFRFLLALNKTQSLDLYIVLRISRTIFHYIEIKKLIKKGIARIAISTDGNPYGNAAMAYYRSGPEITYFTHAFESIQPLSIRVDRAFFHSVESYKVSLNNGSTIGKVNFFPTRLIRRSSIDQNQLRIGIALSKSCCQKSLHQIIKKILNSNSVQKIVVRPHPDSLLNIAVEEVARVEIDVGPDLLSFAEKVDVILGGNTSALIHLACLNKVTIFQRNLESFKGPFLPSISRKVIYWSESFENIEDEIRQASDYYSSKQSLDKLGPHLEDQTTAEIDNAKKNI